MAACIKDGVLFYLQSGLGLFLITYYKGYKALKSIYILLTRSNTIVSRLIRYTTSEKFTHVSISLDEDLTQMYSFARKHDRLPLPAGLKQERVDLGFYARHPDIPYALYELQVDDEVWHGIKKDIDSMICNVDEYHYSLLGLIMCGFGVDYRRERYYFCSQFVAMLLNRNNAVKLPKSETLMHPSDYLLLPELKLVHSGVMGEFFNVKNMPKTRP